MSTRGCTLFKYRFKDKIVVKTGQVFDCEQRTVYLEQQDRQVDRMPSIANKKHFSRKYSKHLLSSSKNAKSTQTSGSVSAERSDQTKKTKMEVDFSTVNDCFLDSYGSCTSS